MNSQKCLNILIVNFSCLKLFSSLFRQGCEFIFNFFQFFPNLVNTPILEERKFAIDHQICSEDHSVITQTQKVSFDEFKLLMRRQSGSKRKFGRENKLSKSSDVERREALNDGEL